uniref:Uncharacterized protein n=1 Tax=viral metagenome TaxID=1070528 RepID=A0A6C0EF83_9ZZZZ
MSEINEVIEAFANIEVNDINDVNELTEPTELELNKIYTINLGDLSHAGLSHEEVKKVYKNGSPASFIMEPVLPKWFNNLVYHNKKMRINIDDEEIPIQPDYIDINNENILYDQKSFNKNGGSFVRSKMKGCGRTKKEIEFQKWAKAQIFIWTDICNLPEVKVIALSGEECLKRFPKGNITYKKYDLLFNPNNN